MLWAAYSNLSNHSLTHDFPYAYMSADAFEKAAMTEAVREQGHFKYDPPYVAAGYTDVVGHWPPIVFILPAIFTNLSGLETYDSGYILVSLIIVFAFLTLYFAIRKINKNIALLSLPLMFLFFTNKFYTGLTWGEWFYLYGSAFLIASFWAYENFDLKRSYLLLSLFIAATIFGHASEFLYGIGFFAVFFGIKLVITKFDKELLKKIIITIILSIIISGYYFVIVKNTYMAAGFSQFEIMSYDAAAAGEVGYPVSTFMDMKLMSYLVIIGVPLAVLLLLKNQHAVILAGFWMMIVGLGNYYGFGGRAFQTRILWPVYFAIFVGIALYYITKFVVKKWDKIISVGISLLLIVLVLIFYYVPITSQGMMNPYHWAALNWIRYNTEEDAVVYFFYGDIYGQTMILFNIHRIPYLIDTNDFIATLQNQTIKRYYKSRIVGDAMTLFPHRTGLLSFDYYMKTNATYKEAEKFYGPMDICQFDYLVLDKLTGRSDLAPLIQYNLAIRAELLNHDWIKEVFSNEVTTILKNNRPGVNCIE